MTPFRKRQLRGKLLLLRARISKALWVARRPLTHRKCTACLGWFQRDDRWYFDTRGNSYCGFFCYAVRRVR
jgi:hypothetical protein